MTGETTPRRRRAIVAGSIGGGLVGLYLVCWAITVLYGFQILPSVLIPDFRPDVPRSSPEITVAEGRDNGAEWRLTVKTLGDEPCTASYVNGRIGAGQCGFKDFPHSTTYSPSTMLVHEQPFLLFGPVPPDTAAVEIDWDDGTQQRVAVRTNPVNRVVYFHVRSDQHAQDVVPVDASDRAVPIPKGP